MATLRACAICARGFVPAHHTHRMCDEHAPVGRESRSPTTQAQDRTYYRNRRILLAGAPSCELRILCDGAPATTADHIVPVAHGGTHDLTNLRPACKPCNSSAGATQGPAPRRPTPTATPTPPVAHATRLS